MNSDRHPAAFVTRRAAPCAIAIAALVVIAVAGCGSSPAQRSVRLPAGEPPVIAHAARTSTASIDQLTVIARRRYADEVGGLAVHRELRRIAHDPALIAALASGDQARLEAYVRVQYQNVWYHEHVSRLRILRGSRVVIDRGVPFVVAPSQVALRDAGGQLAGTLQISMQDVIGFVRYMHRNHHVDVVARGNGGAHVCSSLPAADPAALPDRGRTRIAGKRYDVRSFRVLALDREPVKVWILAARRRP